MKKIFIVILSAFMLCGCSIFENNGEAKKVYTTLYPFEYATKYMYSDVADISSIYPSEADLSTYKLTDKQKEIYSSADIFVYSSLDDEIKLAVDFINNNPDLNIMDATKGLTYTKSIEELWLNPSNYLMVVRNIKNTLNDIETNVINEDKVNSKYNELKIKISELDVEFTMMAKNAKNNNLLITDDALMFLEKYNINVMSIDPNNENYSKFYNESKKAIQNNEIKYIYVLKGKQLSDEILTFITENKLEKIEIDPIINLSEEQRNENKDYLTLMNENIEKFKTELFR